MSNIILAADTEMLRGSPLDVALAVAAEVGFPAVELAPRADLLPSWVGRRASPQAVKQIRAAAAASGVRIASLMVCYGWASPDEAERQAAVGYWQRAISVAAELGCSRLNTELTGDPSRRRECEVAFRRSVEDLLPSLREHSIRVFIEPHPGDFIESGRDAVDLIRNIESDRFGYLYCLPHTFYLGGTIGEQVAESRDVIGHVHLADTFSPGRIIVNPPDCRVRTHQHLDIGQGEIGWAEVFSALAKVSFEGVLTVCVFAWPDRAVDSLRANLRAVRDLAGQAGLTLPGEL